MEVLPDWLRPTDEQVAKEDITFPRTREHLELQKMTYDSLFERVIEQMMEGHAVKRLVNDDPRGVSFGRFMQWVKSDPARLKRYEEAEEIGTEVMADEMKEISDGDGLEDVQRSKLRIDTRKYLMQIRNKKKYGVEKDSNLKSFGEGGVVINITSVESPFATIDNNTGRLIDG